MSVPGYLDDDSGDLVIAGALVADGFDVVRSTDVGMRGKADWEHLEYATRQRRVLITANRSDFGRLHQNWMMEGRSHQGIVIVTQGKFSVGERLRRLRWLLSVRTPDEMINRVEWLNNWRDTEGRD